MIELVPVSVARALFLAGLSSEEPADPMVRENAEPAIGYPLISTPLTARMMLGPVAFGVSPEIDGLVTDQGPWRMYQIIESDADGGARRVVGDIGFHGPPDEQGEVEIGYAVVPRRRRRGIATEACRLILAVAWEAGARRVRADAEAANVASRRVLTKAGFYEFEGLQFVCESPAASR